MNLILISILTLWLNPPTNTTSLTVNINDIDDAGQGKIYILLWDKPDGFPRSMENAKYKGVVNSFSSKASYTFKEIPNGQYAITLFQDKNMNATLDLNFVGIPKEPLGAYNQNGIGRPNFKRSNLILDGSTKSVAIKMMND
ncbi:MAG: DUF2141 domain-containing protein [Bacteroidota bacterium]